MALLGAIYFVLVVLVGGAAGFASAPVVGYRFLVPKHRVGSLLPYAWGWEQWSAFSTFIECEEHKLSLRRYATTYWPNDPKQAWRAQRGECLAVR